uniref:Uncharacterized protein n=1 Tax=Mycena chlorophos TaxID=658473 RepID=A0ABQ0KV32_MYCCL|nr:predicted protein [Mycena chlorophos]
MALIARPRRSSSLPVVVAFRARQHSNGPRFGRLQRSDSGYASSTFRRRRHISIHTPARMLTRSVDAIRVHLVAGPGFGCGPRTRAAWGSCSLLPRSKSGIVEDLLPPNDAHEPGHADGGNARHRLLDHHYNIRMSSQGLLEFKRPWPPEPLAASCVVVWRGERGPVLDAQSGYDVEQIESDANGGSAGSDESEDASERECWMGRSTPRTTYRWPGKVAAI